MNEQFIVKKHRDISEEERTEICNIKSVFGDYSFESQMEWLDKNLKADDCHILLYVENELIAYLNLVDISIKIDDLSIHAYGIGNVCASRNDNGYGGRLMKNLNFFLNKKNKIGLLFCKKNLTLFYKRFNWIVLNQNKVCLSFSKKNIETMIFPNVKDLQCLEYFGKPF